MPTVPELIIMSVYGFGIHLPIHASTHLATAKLIDPKLNVKTFRPYPVIINETLYMDYIGAAFSDTQSFQEYNKMVYTPHLLNTTIYSLTAITHRSAPKRKDRRMLILLGMFVPLIDTTVNYSILATNTYGKACDFAVFNRREKIAIGTAITAAWTYAIYRWLKET